MNLLKLLLKFSSIVAVLWGLLHLIFGSRNRKPIIIGHRGAKGLAPENTLAAIRAGIQSGATHIEIDVQRSADGRLIVFHDLLVERTTNGLGAVGALTWTDLRKLDAGGSFSDQFIGEPIPSLEEVFALIETEPITLVIEAKDPDMFFNIEQELAELIAQFNMEQKVIVISFDLAWLTKFSQIAPTIKTGEIWLAAPFSFTIPHTPIVDVDWITILIDPTFVWRMHRYGKQIWVYTVNQAPLLQWLAWLGVDGLTTDRPDIAKQSLP